MITVKIGDLLRSDAQTLVNTVNAVGVMGKGIAAAFKAEYPDMFRDYARRCRKPDGHPDKVVLGKPYLYQPVVDNQLSFSGEEPVNGKWILNFPTKDHWRGASNLDAIEEGLTYLVERYDQWGITSIAVPPLGCGYGGLEWRVIGPRLYQRLSELEIPVELYAPFGTDPTELDEAFLAGESSVSTGRPDRLPAAELAVAVIVLDLIRDSGIAVNQTRLRSTAYFAAVAGIPRDTTFSWTRHGVRDEAYSVMYSRFRRNGVLIETKQGNSVMALEGPTADGARKLIAADLEQWEQSIRQVIGLQTRLRSPGVLKRASSIHFLASHACGRNPDPISCIAHELDQVGLGGSPQGISHIQTAVEHLSQTGFLPSVTDDPR